MIVRSASQKVSKKSADSGCRGGGGTGSQYDMMAMLPLLLRLRLRWMDGGYDDDDDSTLRSGFT